MSMITNKMIGKYNGYNMYKNDNGMFYFSELINGCFITKAFDNMQNMKNYIEKLEV